MAGQRVTMKDVAKAAGVTTAAVSYAISGKRPISDETRKRVEQAIKELGYTPNMAARTLSSAPQLKNGSITGSPPPWSSMSPFAAMCSTEKLPSAALFSSRSGRVTYSFPVGIYLADIGRPRNLI